MTRRSRSFAALFAAAILASGAAFTMSATPSYAQGQGGRGGGGGGEAGGGSDAMHFLIAEHAKSEHAKSVHAKAVHAKSVHLKLPPKVVLGPNCLTKACVDLVPIPRPRPVPRPPRLERVEHRSCDGPMLGRDPATGQSMVVQNCAARRS
jgi:hypothetical protein